MVHGTPDWGLKKKSTVYALDDMAELAVRLGSIVTFDRRGDVIFLDDFEDGIIRWSTTGVVSSSTTKARSKALSAKLALTEDIGDTAGIQAQIANPVATATGFEFSWLADASVFFLESRVWLYDGSRITKFTITWNHSAKTLSVLDSDGATKVFATGVNIAAASHLFVPCKLVVDISAKKYVRFLMGPYTWLLSAYAGDDAGATTNTYLNLFVYADLLTGAAANIYIDDVILTQNEPT